MIEYLNLPLPSLTEQHRIVAKVDALMALCDELEERLKEREEVQGKLAGRL
jgi:type I restriction enzyme S subunit